MTKYAFKFKDCTLTNQHIHGFSGINLTNNRIVFHENQFEYSLHLQNGNHHAVDVQLWINHGYGNAETAQAPFLLSNPNLAMNGHTSETLELKYNQAPLRDDRESIFWLNIHECPSSHPTHRSIVSSITAQHALIYRPSDLSNLDVTKLNEKLFIQHISNEKQDYFKLENKSAYHLYFAENQFDLPHTFNLSYNEHILAPYQTYFLATNKKAPSNQMLDYVLIDDRGQPHLFQRQL